MEGLEKDPCFINLPWH